MHSDIHSNQQEKKIKSKSSITSLFSLTEFSAKDYSVRIWQNSLKVQNEQPLV